MASNPEVTAASLFGTVKENRVANHPWFKSRFKTGKASKRQLQAFARQLIVYFDNVIEIYGPMYMNNGDYRIRRIFVDKMLTPIKLGDGTKLRLGEGAHAELARQLAGSLGVPARSAKNARATPLVRERIDQIMSTLERPTYWVSLGACTAVDSQMRNLYSGMAKTFKTHYGVAEDDLKLFKAPSLFNAADINHALAQVEDVFDGLRLTYYTERLRDEFYQCWDAVFAAAQ